MSRKKPQADDLQGTVEGAARDHFEREKAAYEERTGQKVEFVPPMPLTRTPLPATEDQLPDAGKMDEEVINEKGE